MKTHKSDFQYWVDKGWITQGWADYYASQANFKPLKSMAFQAVKQEIQELEPLQTCDISDILEGATVEKSNVVLDTGAVPTGQSELGMALIGALERKPLRK